MSSEDITGYNKIIAHPDKDEIIEKLAAGVSVRQIEAWLKAKYPGNKRCRISFMSLQSFRKNYLKLENDVLKQIQEERRTLALQKKREIEFQNVQKTSGYKVGLANYVQDSLIDYNNEILNIIEDCKEGIKNLKELNEDKGSHLNHQAIATYITRLQDMVQLHRKFIAEQEKKAGDKLEEDYDTLNQKMEILIESVKDAFAQTNPEGLSVFIQLVKDRMTSAGLV